MNNYIQTTYELFGLQKYAIKLGLANISKLCNDFNNPHLQYPSIHIAGTNGKGSTAFYISKILQTCGLKVGLFTSPHLVDFRERIRINNNMIDKQYIIDFWNEIKKSVLSLKATFFDTTTLLAFKYFADNNIDIAVFETGLGGRLDSTNILQSEYAVLTPVSFDHQKQLGNTLSSIAAEKAGIIKHKSKIFCARQNRNVLDIFKSKSKINSFYYLPDHIEITMKSLNLKGLKINLQDKTEKQTYIIKLPTIAAYQAENFALAFAVTKALCEDKNIDYPFEKIRKIISQSTWPGRLQLMQTNPQIFFDVSHNLLGIKTTVNIVAKLSQKNNIDLLLGIVNDKDANGIVKFLTGKFRNIIISEPQTIRKKDGEILLKMFKARGQNTKFIKDLTLAFEISKNNLTADDTLIALGSHYLIGALMRIG